jgi:hypothetical protein
MRRRMARSILRTAEPFERIELHRGGNRGRGIGSESCQSLSIIAAR